MYSLASMETTNSVRWWVWCCVKCEDGEGVGDGLIGACRKRDKCKHKDEAVASPTSSWMTTLCAL